MILTRLFFPLVAALLFGLSGCSPKDSASATAPAKREVTLEAAAQGKGFTVGSMMSATTVYVFFDTQCPHCGHLWQASMPLHKKAKFVWIPIGMINASSKSQGAALLTAADPLALMTEHETSLLAGKGGIAASAGVSAEIEEAIKANTQLFNSFGAEAVPYVVAKNLRTGQTLGRAAAMDTGTLAAFAGIDWAP
jgi:thiol:disulfide interchange protein DsbG